METKSGHSYNITSLSAWIRVTGEDSAHFLQGQFSNDLKDGFKKCINNWYLYGLWLDHKGKIIADSTLVKTDVSHQFWIHSNDCLAADICARLEGFIIADDVSLSNETEQWSSLVLFGSNIRKLLEESNLKDIYIFNGRRGTEESYEVIYPRSGEAKVLEIIKDFDRITSKDLEILRIKAVIPRIPQDGGNTDLPQEIGLGLDAISFTKGCYVGQEVMARLNSRGRTRRKLCRVKGDGVPPSLPCAVFDLDAKVGELKSVVAYASGYLGLALLSVAALEKASEFSLEAHTTPKVKID